MSRWICKCGQEMGDGGDGSPCSLIVPRPAVNDLIEIATSGNPQRTPNEEQIDVIVDAPELWTCPACGRMHVIRDGVTVEYWQKESA